MAASSVTISQGLYERLRERAIQSQRSPDELAESLLQHELNPPHPYIETEVTRFGSRAVIKGTRVGVASIIAYQRFGLSPEKITEEILPHLTLAQVHDALSYFYDHQEEIEIELAQDSEGEAMKKLRAMIGSEEAFRKITGNRVKLNG